MDAARAPGRYASTHGDVSNRLSGFTRLFKRGREPLSAKVLAALAYSMNQRSVSPPEAVEKTMPSSGYTYLGQFIDHDLTADLRQFSDPPGASPRNARTPRFDLDTLYGADAPREPLYDGPRLRLAQDGRDFLRDDKGLAIVADPRNDSNRLLSQVHLAFARFHNRVVDDLPPATADFATARRFVTWHYQWIVLRDFLPKMTDASLVNGLLDGDAAARRLYIWRPRKVLAVPLEFTAAAFRFGHSMVRNDYMLGPHGPTVLTFDAGRQGNDAGADDLRGLRPLPPDFGFDWSMFFKMPGSPNTPNAARPIDTYLAGSLYALPFSVAQDTTFQGCVLAYRNLHRGEIDLKLACAQDIVPKLRRRGVPGLSGPLPGFGLPAMTHASLSPQQTAETGVDSNALMQVIEATTPLWYYVLSEAEQLANGRHLGPVAARLVAETMVGLMRDDRDSVLNNPWRPHKGDFGCPADGAYTMVDLLAYLAS